MKIILRSNSLVYGLLPDPSSEMAQSLSVTSEGHVEFTSYTYSSVTGCREKDSMKLIISQEKAALILYRIEKYFSQEHEIIYVTDVGSWELEMIRSDNESFKAAGPLYIGDPALRELSDFVRNTLDMPELLLFDGNAFTARINKMSICYRRIVQCCCGEDEKAEGSVEERRESYVLDRESGTLEFVKNVSGYQIEEKIQAMDEISEILDIFIEIPFLDDIEGNSTETIFDPEDVRKYSITAEFSTGEIRTVSGTFDRKGLPSAFPEMAGYLSAFLSYYRKSDIITPAMYEKVYRSKTDCIFCNVMFDDWGRTYCYLTDDDTIKAGDHVRVPAGRDNREVTVLVDSIEYHPADEAPYPMEKIKRVIRKCQEDEFDENDEEEMGLE